MKYKPLNHQENRMKHEGDTLRARKIFYDNVTKNLYFLVQKRFSWMNEYIRENDVGIEVDMTYLKNKGFRLYVNHII